MYNVDLKKLSTLNVKPNACSKNANINYLQHQPLIKKLLGRNWNVAADFYVHIFDTKILKYAFIMWICLFLYLLAVLNLLIGIIDDYTIV